MASYQNTSSDRRARAGANHRAVERALDSVTRPAAEHVHADAFGDPTRLAAHEIRSHLGLLTGYLSLLLEGAMGEVPDAVAAVLAEMDAKAHAISHLVDDMLEDARFQDGRLHLALQVTDLCRVVEQAIDSARAGLPESHCLEVHLPERELAAEVDPGRIGTILRNLLDNAVKYSPDGGKVECRLEAAGEAAVISVVDEGVGIDSADADFVFRRFGRARGAATSAISGVGLGLYISRTLARLHGGEIRVKPRPGGGSEFIVTLPLRQRSITETAVHEPHSQTSEGSRKAN